MRFEPLDGKRHDRKQFDCGVQALNDYVMRFAGQDARRGLARTWVLADERRIIGYYTLSAHSVPRTGMPPDVAAGVYEEIPFLLLGRLAVDLAFQRRGYGDALIAHAFRSTRDAADRFGIFGMIVDAKDEAAALYYEGFGFQRLEGDRRRLMLPIGAMDRLLLRQS